MLSSIYAQQKAGAEPKRVLSKKSSKAITRASASSRGSREASPEAADTAVVSRLQQFDLSTDFGPCTGMTRSQRWKRAQKFGLHPPADVQKLLEAHPELDDCIWHGRI